MRSPAGLVGLTVIAAMALACFGSLPWTLGGGDARGTPRYKLDDPRAARLPPAWATPDREAQERLNRLVEPVRVEAIARKFGVDPRTLVEAPAEASPAERDAARALRSHWPTYTLGTDLLGRSVLVRLLAGGAVSLGIGVCAALISVVIGTLYGAASGYFGGRIDAVMMRTVDVLFGLPYVLLVVLIAVASDAALDEFISRGHARARWVEREAAAVARDRGLPTDRASVRAVLAADTPLRTSLEDRALAALPERSLGEPVRVALDLGTLLVAIGGVSWLTLARVVRGQVLSLKARPFMEAARAVGVGWSGQFFRHLLPNLVGPVIVYATLTVPQAILQESFLSFLGIGVKPPMPSWGNLAADALGELNPYRSHWWLLLFPCLLLGLTLLALNFVGEGLREAMDPRRPSGGDGAGPES